MSTCLQETKIVLLLTGSFNPPTNMHLRMFELVRDWIHHFHNCKVVGGILSPVHDSYGKKGLLPAVHRCTMAKLAIQSSDWLHLSQWETEQENWTRTAMSLKYHQEIINNTMVPQIPVWASKIQSQVLEGETGKPLNLKLKLLCGADLLESFAVPGLWSSKDIEDIINNYGLVVVTRAGTNPERFIYESDLLTKLQRNICIVPEWISNEISSTKVRRAIRRNESVKYLIQDSVIDYIKENSLYLE